MTEYLKVLPGRQISINMFDLMEDADLTRYNGANRTGSVKAINDVLQGRAGKGIDALIADLQSVCGQSFPERTAALCGQIKDFKRQKMLMHIPYSKSAPDAIDYDILDPEADRPLKIITQDMYDHALNKGFPPDFFRESHFDKVIFYCVPYNTDFTFSSFRDCRFNLCRLHGACFDGTSIYNTDFHTVDIKNATFYTASIAHTFFYDSAFQMASFQKARLKSCHITDCVMERVNYLDTTLDGCSFRRITASGIKNLDTAVITMGGATPEECQRNRDAIGTSLNPLPGRAPAPPKKIRKRTDPTR